LEVGASPPAARCRRGRRPKIGNGRVVCLTIEGWDGAVRTLSWPLDAPGAEPAAGVAVAE
jgi:hypothetical protein